MPVTGESVTPAVHGAPAGGGWMYLQPMPVALSSTTLDHYLHKQSIGLGAAQIVLGSLCIVFNLVSLAVGRNYYIEVVIIGHGFWCGVLFIVTGALGISAGKSKTKCKIVSYMVLCIISACFTAVLFSVGIIGAFVSGYRACHDYGYGKDYGFYYSRTCSAANTVVAMESCMAVSAFIAAILFIWGSALCCKAKPCCSTPYSVQQQVLLPLNHDSNNGLQLMQSVQYPSHTMPYQPGDPPAYQPQLMLGTSATGPYPIPNSKPTSEQGYVG